MSDHNNLSDLPADDLVDTIHFTTAVARKWCRQRDLHRADYDDAVQEAHMAVARAMSSYDTARPLKPYLCACIRNHLSTWHHHKRQWLRHMDDVRAVQRQRPSVRVCFVDDLVDWLALMEVRTMLSYSERRLLSLLLDGATAFNIGRAYGRTTESVRDDIRSLIRKLRELLADD